MLLTQNAYEAKIEELRNLVARLGETRKERVRARRQSAGKCQYDNFDYEQADMEERLIIIEINRIRNSLREVEILDDVDEENNGTVRVGSRVVLELQYGDEDVETLELTVCDLPDLSSETVTLNSPIGGAIYNKKIEFIGECELSDGNVIKIKILDIK